MRITAGAESGQVVQRDASGMALVRFEGFCGQETTGPVTLRVSGPNVDRDEQAGEAADGTWSAPLSDLPAGGPYRVDLACGSETAQVSDLYVGEVWVLAGQSNMEGAGDLCMVEQPMPRVRVMDLADRWVMAEEPLHWIYESVDSAHWGCDAEMRRRLAVEQRSNRVKGAGLGLPFGIALSTTLDVPVGLIASARGGASMQDWSPTLLPSGGASLYGSMIRRIRKAGGVRGILWYQGESDTNPVDGADYPGRFRTFIEAVRTDLGQPDLPILYVQLGRFVSESSLADLRSWNSVQEAQRRAVLAIPNVAMAAAVDLELDDAVHIATGGLRRLGRRLATLSRRLVYGDNHIKSGPQLGRISVDGPNRDRIRIEFHNVNGSLWCADLLSGFSLRNLDGHHIPIIYKEEIEPGHSNVILLWLTRTLPPGCSLHYGWGRDPYCNLRDELDLAAPVFGPVRL